MMSRGYFHSSSSTLTSYGFSVAPSLTLTIPLSHVDLSTSINLRAFPIAACLYALKHRDTDIILLLNTTTKYGYNATMTSNRCHNTYHLVDLSSETISTFWPFLVRTPATLKAASWRAGSNDENTILSISRGSFGKSCFSLRS